MLLHTDGLGTTNPDGEPVEPNPLLESVVRHRSLPIPEFIQRLATELRPLANPEDDFTLLGMEMRDCRIGL